MTNFISLPQIKSDQSILRFIDDKDEKIEQVNNLRLIAYLSGSSSICTKSTLKENNFILKKQHQPKNFSIGWGNPKSIRFYREMPQNSIYYQIPGSTCFGRKDNLARLLKSTNLIPETYILPEQIGIASRALKTGIYLYKPALQARGLGIKILQKGDNIPSQRAAVLQKYIIPVLVDNYKFDLRMYAFISSVDPLIVYVYDEGIARFATQKWQKPNRTNLGSKKMHLTNYAVNKEAVSRQAASRQKAIEDIDNVDADRQAEDNDPSYKQLANSLFDFLDINRHEFSSIPIDNTEPGDGKLKRFIKDQINNAVQQIFIAAEPHLFSKGKVARTSLAIPRKVAALYGIDFVLARDCQIQVFEVNVQCSTGTNTELDKKLKYPMMKTIFDIVGLRIKGQQIIPFFSQEENNVIDMLKISEYEKRVIWQLYDENNRCGKFKRVLPDKQIQYCENRYLTKLVKQWLCSNNIVETFFE